MVLLLLLLLLLVVVVVVVVVVVIVIVDGLASLIIMWEIPIYNFDSGTLHKNQDFSWSPSVPQSNFGVLILHTVKYERNVVWRHSHPPEMKATSRQSRPPIHTKPTAPSPGKSIKTQGESP
jgi:hypothetical protein